MITIDEIVHSIIRLKIPHGREDGALLVSSLMSNYDNYLLTTSSTLRSLPNPHEPTIKEIQRIRYLLAYQHRDIYKSLHEQLKLQKLQNIL